MRRGIASGAAFNLTMKPRLLLGLAALGLAGCALTPLPPEAANIVLVGVPSAAIEIWRPRLRMKDGELSIEAYIFRQHGAETTADSHVDLVFTDALGRVLMVDTTSFYPRSLPRASRLPQPHGYFRVPIVRLPNATRSIEVRGHDGPHGP